MPTPHAGAFGAEPIFLDSGALAAVGLHVTVVDPGTGVPVVIYGDRTRSTTVTQPLLVDAAHRLFLYAEPGEVRLLGTGLNQVVTVFVDPADVPGPTGPTGATGAAGATGGVGPAGPTGATGAAGAQGVAGPSGGVGPQGATGAGFSWEGTWDIALPYLGMAVVERLGSMYVCIQANTGLQPETHPAYWQISVEGGALGLTGPAGPTGPTGAAGATGPAGSNGTDGAAGAPGAGFTWKGPWNGATAYLGNDWVQRNGRSYECILANTGQDPATSPTYWQLSADKGADGTNGATGATGATGSTGATGATGPTGPAGATGPPGSTWTLFDIAADPELMISGTITRNSNDAVTTASVVWPDGSTGTYTALTFSSNYPGAVDSYQITHFDGVTTVTYTQPPVTRNLHGVVTTRPAIHT